MASNKIFRKQAAEPMLSGITNEGRETSERLDRSWNCELVPKPGFEPGHPCGR